MKPITRTQAWILTPILWGVFAFLTYASFNAVNQRIYLTILTTTGLIIYTIALSILIIDFILVKWGKR